MTAELTVVVETSVADSLSLLLFSVMALPSATAGVGRVRIRWSGRSINSSYKLLVELQPIETLKRTTNGPSIVIACAFRRHFNLI